MRLFVENRAQQKDPHGNGSKIKKMFKCAQNSNFFEAKCSI